MTDQKREQERRVIDAMPADWDKKPLSLAYEIMGFLQSIKDEGTEIDSGTNGITGDLWVTAQGVEYFISITRSAAQLSKEGKIIPGLGRA